MMWAERVTRESVGRGARLLDQINPGWHRKIDRAKLDFGSLADCVLGQLYGSLAEGYCAIPYLATPGPTQFGFGTSHGFNTFVVNFSDLRKIWLDEIELREKLLGV